MGRFYPLQYGSALDSGSSGRSLSPSRVTALGSSVGKTLNSHRASFLSSVKCVPTLMVKYPKCGKNNHGLIPSIWVSCNHG